MRVFLAWHNTCSSQRRLLAAMAGVTFVVLLMFMELGSLETIRRASTLVYDALDFDLILVSSAYEYMNAPGSINEAHLARAGTIPGIAQVMPVNYDTAPWEDPDTRILSSTMVLGLDIEPHFVRDPRILQGLASIEKPRSVLADEMSNPSLGPIVKDRSVKIDDRVVTITSVFRMGMSFFAQGAIIVNNQTFRDLLHRRNSQVSFGLIRLAEGADSAAVGRRLKEILPPDVVLLERNRFLQMERDHYTMEMPLGIMSRTAVIVSILVGAAVLFQILSTDLSNRYDEYATLKAAGFTARYIYGVGLQQSTILALMGYFPAALLAQLVFYGTRIVTRLPIFMTGRLALTVFGLTLSMCLGSGVLALSKVHRADPVELF